MRLYTDLLEALKGEPLSSVFSNEEEEEGEEEKEEEEEKLVS